MARKLSQVDGRTRVRSVFARHWPNENDEDEEDYTDTLGRQTVAAARDDETVISAIAEVTGRTHASVTRALRRADGRARVYSLFAHDWPEDDDDDG